MNPVPGAWLDLRQAERGLRAALDPLARAQGGRVSIAGLNGSAASLLLSSLLEVAPGGKIVLVVPGEKEATQLRSDLAFAIGALRSPASRVRLFAALEADPYQELEPHLGVACERVQALRALRDPGEAVVVAPARALITPLAPPDAFDLYRLELRPGQAIQPDEVSGFLLAAGYVRVDLVASMGEFSRRGGIIDFFPPEGREPVRAEFWGEEIDSLRLFDPGTQRSADRLERTIIDPVREYPWDAEALGRLLESLRARRQARRGNAASELLAGQDDLAERLERLASGRTFPGFEACVRLVEPSPASLFDYAPAALRVSWESGQALADLEAVYMEMHQSLDLTETFGMPPPDDLLLPRARLQEQIGAARLRLSELALDEEDLEPYRVACAPPRRYKGRLQELAADLKGESPGGAAPSRATLFLMESLGRIERLAEVLQEYGLTPRVLMPTAPGNGAPAAVERAGAPSAAATGAAAGGPVAGLLIAPGRLSQGFALTAAGLQVLTETEVFGEHAAEHQAPRRKVAAFSADFRDLKVGDLVVHAEHGIGRYAGIARIGEGETQRDFMLLHYEGRDKLYVPIDRLDLVQRYSGIAGRRPHLDKLGGPGWERTKKKVKKAMREMAEELLQLYAARRAARGHAFAADAPWQKEFEDAFPYTLTPDQDKAIRETKADMESDGPMDRLICGDVGFGKTEVAMRAAFKAVMEGKQAAVLCPTTVLAFQHLTTFRERFSSWPTTIEMISRFRAPKEQAEILKAVREGKIDILIGTHRLLSKDVAFRDLGLLVVDEEQRFGVAHKEAIKAMKKTVDVLTLTATPIPRTLQMSLAGLRDMSVIETPPENRLAIQTAVVPFKEGIIATAIHNELKRDGQVYFVHNRIESIGSMSNLLHRLAPEARIGIAHGQMVEGALEKTMIAFLEGAFDVLLSTTIVENGLDIPRVNTIIVNRADRFGLAQLYQLRGRVGRSDRRAYAYMLVPVRKALTPVARRRLKALQEFTELGSGFRIAAMDLEIRGAGNLLGAEQSGEIASVGFEMYCQLLERAVREMKGEPPPPEFKAQINLGVDIRIPEEFIGDFSERLVLYKRISGAGDDRELARIRDQIRDLYGEPPRQAEHLLEMASLRLMAERLRIRQVDSSAGRALIRFSPDSPVSPDRLVALATGRAGVSLTPQGVLRVDFTTAAAAERERLEAVRAVLQGLLPSDTIQQPAAHPSAIGPSKGDR